MDWLNNLLPEGINYWIVVSLVLAALNVYQFALAHKMMGWLEHMQEHGHAPDGTVLVRNATLIKTPEGPELVSANPAEVVDESLPWNRSKKT